MFFNFQLLWGAISAALVRIAGQISPAKKSEWQAAIDSLLTDPLTADDERNVQELKEWYKSDMDLKGSVEHMKKELDETKAEVKELKTKILFCPCALCEPITRYHLRCGFEEPSISAPLPINIDCMAPTIEHDPRGGPFPSAQDVLNYIAIKYITTVNPSTPEEWNAFVNYLEKVRKVVIVETRPGSLIITVKCSSLQILEDLWNDYCSGRLNEMAQKCLVTEEVLNDLNLKEAKLTTTILEEEYRTCKETLKLFSGLGELWKQRNQFLRQFLHWAQTRRRARALLAELIRKLGDSSLSRAAVATLLGGAVLIPFTFGTSMLFGAGAAAATAGVAQLAGTVMNTRESQSKVTEVITQDVKAFEELQEKLGSLEKCTTDFAVLCHEHIDLLSSQLVQDELGFLLDILRRRDREELQAEKAEAPILPALPTLLQDEVNICFSRVSTLMQQLQHSTATKSEISRVIQQILADLRECPKDEEMDTMVEDFIKEIFDRKLSSLGFRLSDEAMALLESDSIPPLPASPRSLPSMPLSTPLESPLLDRPRKTSKKKKKVYAT